MYHLSHSVARRASRRRALHAAKTRAVRAPFGGTDVRERFECWAAALLIVPIYFAVGVGVAVQIATWPTSGVPVQTRLTLGAMACIGLVLHHAARLYLPLWDAHTWGLVKALAVAAGYLSTLR